MFNLQLTSTTMKLLPVVRLCLLTWSGITFADQHGPLIVKEGSDVTLPCSVSENIEFKRFEWKKDGQKEVFVYDAGIYSNGRVSHFPDELSHGNASIIIRDMTMADSGVYTCDFPRLKPRQTFYIQLVVGPLIVKEGSDVTLPCSVSENIESKRFEWKKDGEEVFFKDAEKQSNKRRVSYFPDEVGHGNASIKITNTTVADRGVYTCDFPRLEPRQTFYIQLVVDGPLKDRSKENIKGASPRPHVTTHRTKDGVLLKCEVHGASPKPELQWRDSDGNILPAEDPQVSERGGSYDITLNITVTKTDDFRCVATQETINHTIYTETYVPLNGAASEPSVTILKTNDGSLLQCVVRGASPKPELQWRDSSGNILPAEDPQVSERGGSYDIILQAAVTKTDNYRCVATQETINHQTHREIYVPLNGSNTGWIVAAVLSALLVAVLIAVLYDKGVIKLNCKKGPGPDPATAKEESPLTPT